MENTKGYALVTGASKGIGKEIARQLAQQGWPLLLVARSEDLLLQLKTEFEAAYKVPVAIFAADLAQPEVPMNIVGFCQQKGLRVQILINNAGFGVWDKFEKASFAELEAMNALNVNALLRMCHAFLPLLRQNRQAWLLNVASLGAYQPLPYLALYGAGKAYVRSFTYALRAELRDSPISVTCLSPGSVYTDFADRAGSLSVVESNKRFTMSAEQCARTTLKAMFRGKAETIPGWYNRLGALLTKISPTTVTARAAGRIMFKPD
ncbi:MAG TPA: SDR family oxidoreductase [Bacteroidia bacterium]|jgi:short-subunit dehydrogenase|nr:SDR family oxidoreductase [Bacteroidia bacterium]